MIYRPDSLAQVDQVLLPHNAIAVAQALQAQLDAFGTPELLVHEALQLLGPQVDVYGSRRVAIHADAAYVLEETAAMEEGVFKVEIRQMLASYEGIVLAGWFGNISFVRLPDIASLCAEIYDPVVLHSVDPYDISNRPLPQPLAIPVAGIELAIPIAA